METDNISVERTPARGTRLQVQAPLARRHRSPLRSASRIILYLTVLLLAGCATHKRLPGTGQGFFEVACPPDKSVVYLYRVRPWIGQAKDIMMCMNYLPTVSLSGHEYCPLLLNPGLTQFGHQYQVVIPPMGIPATTKSRVDLRVHLEAGKTYFVAYRFWISPFHSPNPTMVLVDRQTGTNEMSTCWIKKPINGSHEN
jgi:hypothetical protein